MQQFVFFIFNDNLFAHNQSYSLYILIRLSCWREHKLSRPTQHNHFTSTPYLTIINVTKTRRLTPPTLVSLVASHLQCWRLRAVVVSWAIAFLFLRPSCYKCISVTIKARMKHPMPSILSSCLFPNACIRLTFPLLHSPRSDHLSSLNRVNSMSVRCPQRWAVSMHVDLQRLVVSLRSRSLYTCI